MLRSAFSFAVGILIHQAWRAGRLPSLPVPPVAVLLAFLALVYLVPYGGDHAIRNAFLAVGIVSPVIVAVAMPINPPGPIRRLSVFSGRISYPTYTIHGPLFVAASAAYGGAHEAPTWVYLAVAAAVLVAASPLERRVDAPVRRRLSRLLRVSRESVAKARPL